VYVEANYATSIEIENEFFLLLNTTTGVHIVYSNSS